VPIEISQGIGAFVRRGALGFVNKTDARAFKLRIPKSAFRI